MKKLLTKYFEGISENSEQRELLELLRREKNLKAFQEEKQQWKEKTYNSPMNLNIAYKWSKLKSKLNQQLLYERLQRRYFFMKYAAVALLVISLTTSYFLYNNNKETMIVADSTITTDNGQVSKLTLPDGSEVWINSSSILTYNSQFGISNRDFQLEGEAFFKVAKNIDLPFHVNSGELIVTALGTEFCVSNYKETGKIDVVLEEGAVKINSIIDDGFELRLAPDEIASYDLETYRVLKKRVNTKLYTSWRDGIIHFNQSTMEEIVFKLEKRYNQKFTMDDNVRNLHFNLTVSNEDLNDVIAIIELVSNVESHNEGEVIHFTLKDN